MGAIAPVAMLTVWLFQGTVCLAAKSDMDGSNRSMTEGRGGGFPGTRVKGKNPPGGLAPCTPAPRAAGGGRWPMASFTPCGVPARLGKNDRQGLLPPAYYRRTMRRVLFWGLGD
jgi:hypothetical protein